MEQRFNITEAAGISGLKEHQIRSIENYLKIKFGRDASKNRFFTPGDIEMLKLVKEARDNSIPYELIRKQFEKEGILEPLQEEAIANTPIESLTIVDVKNLMQETLVDIMLTKEQELVARVLEPIEQKLEKLDKVESEISELRRENEELKSLLNNIIENQNKKKGFLGLFK